MIRTRSGARVHPLLKVEDASRNFLMRGLAPFGPRSGTSARSNGPAVWYIQQDEASLMPIVRRRSASPKRPLSPYKVYELLTGELVYPLPSLLRRLRRLREQESLRFHQ